MRKLIGLDGRTLSELYREGISAVKCTLWKPESVREEAFHERLRRSGISFSGLNFRLYLLDIPNEAGRFPDLLNIDSLFIDLVHNRIDDFDRNWDNQRSGLDEKAKSLASYLAREIADVIAYSPETFKRYRL